MAALLPALQPACWTVQAVLPVAADRSNRQWTRDSPLNEGTFKIVLGRARKWWALAAPPPPPAGRYAKFNDSRRLLVGPWPAWLSLDLARFFSCRCRRRAAVRRWVLVADPLRIQRTWAVWVEGWVSCSSLAKSFQWVLPDNRRYYNHSFHWHHFDRYPHLSSYIKNLFLFWRFRNKIRRKKWVVKDSFTSEWEDKIGR